MICSKFKLEIQNDNKQINKTCSGKGLFLDLYECQEEKNKATTQQ